jgi:hypothetical protein
MINKFQINTLLAIEPATDMQIQKTDVTLPSVPVRSLR